MTISIQCVKNEYQYTLYQQSKLLCAVLGQYVVTYISLYIK